jgi:hypothetical protein
MLDHPPSRARISLRAVALLLPALLACNGAAGTTGTSSTGTSTGSAEPGPCKPAGVAPEVMVGRGQVHYIAMNDGDRIQVVAPPQGGHVIWLAARQTGLEKTGSVTSATGHMDDFNLDMGPSDVPFAYEEDEGGYCVLYGLPLPIDDKHAVSDLLGKTMKVTITVTDEGGGVGVGARTVQLSDDIQ